MTAYIIPVLSTIIVICILIIITLIYLLFFHSRMGCIQSTENGCCRCIYGLGRGYTVIGADTSSDKMEARPLKLDPLKPDSLKPGPLKPGPVKPGPVKLDPVKPGPVKPAPVKPGPVKPGPVKPGPVKPAPVKLDPVKPAPVKLDPVKPAPMKLDPVEPSLLKPDPPEVDPPGTKEFPMMETSGSCVDLGGLSQGSRVTVAGTVIENAQLFTIDFMSANGGFAVHIDIRLNFFFTKSVIIMNSKEVGKIFPSNFKKRIPFQDDQFEAGKDYKLAFEVFGDEFKISNHGVEIGRYTLPAAFSWETVSRVCILNETRNITVTLEKP